MSKEKLVWIRFTKIWSERAFSSMINSFDHYYEQKLTIVANKLFILDQDTFAEEMIEHCIDNDFHEVKFSYDLLGSLEKIEITVYLSERDRKCTYQSFVIEYGWICRLQTEIKYRITKLTKNEQ